MRPQDGLDCFAARLDAADMGVFLEPRPSCSLAERAYARPPWRRGSVLCVPWKVIRQVAANLLPKVPLRLAEAHCLHRRSVEFVLSELGGEKFSKALHDMLHRGVRKKDECGRQRCRVAIARD